MNYYSNSMYSPNPVVSSAIQMNAHQAVTGQLETLNYFERSGAVLLIVIAIQTITYISKVYYSYKDLHSALTKEKKKLHPIIEAWYSLTLINIIFLLLVLITYMFNKKHLVISYILLLMGLTGLGSIIVSLIIYVQVLPDMKLIEPKLFRTFQKDLVYEIILGAFVTFVGLSTWFLTYNCDCVDVRYNKDDGILTQRFRHVNVDSEINNPQTHLQSQQQTKKPGLFRLFH